jgi:uncharacterized membrane protein
MSGSIMNRRPSRSSTRKNRRVGVSVLYGTLLMGRVVCASVMVVIVVIVVIVLLCRSSKPTIDFHHVRSAYDYDDHGQGQETQETNETHG